MIARPALALLLGLASVLPAQDHVRVASGEVARPARADSTRDAVVRYRIDAGNGGVPDVREFTGIHIRLRKP